MCEQQGNLAGRRSSNGQGAVEVEVGGSSPPADLPSSSEKKTNETRNPLDDNNVADMSEPTVKSKDDTHETSRVTGAYLRSKGWHTVRNRINTLIWCHGGSSVKTDFRGAVQIQKARETVSQ